MATYDKRIDAYIVRSADFAIPILEHLREVIHEACPDVEETMKWSFPHFQYSGAILCSMASFKQHCAFVFWLASRMDDPDGIFETSERSAMGHLGRITSLKDLPSKRILVKYIRQAMALTDQGATRPIAKPVTKDKKELKVPSYFTTYLKKNKKAFDAFSKFSFSHQKEYVEWITEAKTEQTRNKRMTTAIEWLSEGKPRNWKYMKT